MCTLFLKNQLNKQNNQYEDIVQQTLHILSQTFNSLIMKGSINGHFYYVSPNVASMLGYSMDEMIGKKLTCFVHHHDAKMLKENDHTVLQKESSDSSYKVRLRKKDGCFLWAQVDVHLLTDESKHESEYMYTIKEVPFNQEEDRVEYDKMSLISQLAAGVAHEIRNPLTSLKGFIQLMKSDKTLNEQYLEIMENEIDRIDTISNELMIFAKPKLSVFKYCDLKLICESCMTLLEGEAVQKRIDFIKEYPDESVYVYGDENKLKQVIINLLKNAIEAMDEPGNVTIQINKDSNQGVLQIKDEGCGISKELVDKLGQPFFTTKKNGNGLGLMMCFRIIEEHHGKIEVQSELGRGSTFKIALPLEINMSKKVDLEKVGEK